VKVELGPAADIRPASQAASLDRELGRVARGWSQQRVGQRLQPRDLDTGYERGVGIVELRPDVGGQRSPLTGTPGR